MALSHFWAALTRARCGAARSARVGLVEPGGERPRAVAPGVVLVGEARRGLLAGDPCGVGGDPRGVLGGGRQHGRVGHGAAPQPVVPGGGDPGRQPVGGRDGQVADGLRGRVEFPADGEHLLGLGAQPAFLLGGVACPFLVEAGRAAAHRAGVEVGVGAVVGERAGEEFGAAQRVLGGRAPQVLGGGDGFAQPGHGRGDRLGVGSGQGGAAAQVEQEGLVHRAGPDGQFGRPREVRAPPAQCGVGAPGAGVVGAGQEGEQSGEFGLRLLGGRVVLAAQVAQPLVGGGELLQPEDGGDGVVHLAGLAADHLAELGVRQEGAVGRQVLLPAETREGDGVVAGPVEFGGGVGDVVPVPGAQHGGQLGIAVETQLHGDLGFLAVVEVAPALAPDVAAAAPAGVVAGQRDLDGLREARLAGAVAAGDQGESRAGGEGETCGTADAAEAADRDGLQVGARHPAARPAVVLEGGEQEGSGVLVEVRASEPPGEETGKGAGGRILGGLPCWRRVRGGIDGYGHDGTPVEATTAVRTAGQADGN